MLEEINADRLAQGQNETDASRPRELATIEGRKSDKPSSLPSQGGEPRVDTGPVRSKVTRFCFSSDRAVTRLHFLFVAYGMVLGVGAAVSASLMGSGLFTIIGSYCAIGAVVALGVEVIATLAKFDRCDVE